MQNLEQQSGSPSGTCQHVQRVWKAFCDYRDLWQQRIKFYTSFVIEIAAFDCEQPGRNEADDGPELALIPVFTHLPNNTFVASSLEDIKDRADIFTEVHSTFFSAVFHQVVAWLISPSCMIYYIILYYIYILNYIILYFILFYFIILYICYIIYMLYIYILHMDCLLAGFLGN